MTGGDETLTGGGPRWQARSGEVEGPTDAELLRRFVLRGQDAGPAFESLMGRHGPMVLRICRDRVEDAHAAQDAYQSTFLILVEKADTLWVRDSLRFWLRGVAIRVANRARANGSSRRRRERSIPLDPADATVEPDIEEIRATLRDQVARLPRAIREAVTLCYFEGLTHEQAARRLGWPVGTVKSRLSRARARLRDELGRRGLSLAGSPMALLLPSGLGPSWRAGGPPSLLAKKAATVIVSLAVIVASLIRIYDLSFRHTCLD